MRAPPRPISRGPQVPAFAWTAAILVTGPTRMPAVPSRRRRRDARAEPRRHRYASAYVSRLRHRLPRAVILDAGGKRLAEDGAVGEQTTASRPRFRNSCPATSSGPPDHGASCSPGARGQRACNITDAPRNRPARRWPTRRTPSTRRSGRGRWGVQLLPRRLRRQLSSHLRLAVRAGRSPIAPSGGTTEGTTNIRSSPIRVTAISCITPPASPIGVATECARGLVSVGSQ